MNLDQVAGACCGLIAGCVFFLHASSDPGRKSWINLPQYMRWGLVAVGTTFTIRSTDFFSISDQRITLGHVNLAGTAGSLAMTYLAGTTVLWVLRHRMADSTWARTQEVVESLAADKGLVPAAIRKDDAVVVLRAIGARATKPGEPPEALNDDARQAR